MKVPLEVEVIVPGLLGTDVPSYVIEMTELLEKPVPFMVTELLIDP